MDKPAEVTEPLEAETALAPEAEVPEAPEQWFAKWNRADRRRIFPVQEKRGFSRSTLAHGKRPPRNDG